MFGVSQSLLKYKVTRFASASTQYISVGDVSELKRVLADPWSASFWFRADSLTAQGKVFGKETVSGFHGYYVNIWRSGLANINWGIGTTFERVFTRTDRDDLDDGLWHHWAGTYNGNGDESGMQHYIDGAAVSHSVINNNAVDTVDTTAPFLVGARFNENTAAHDLLLDADLQDLAIFDGVLTAGEVASLYNNAAPPDMLDITFSSATLVAYWIMGEHKGDVGGVAAGVTSGTTVPDLSASENDGTMVNGPLVVTRL